MEKKFDRLVIFISKDKISDLESKLPGFNKSILPFHKRTEEPSVVSLCYDFSKPLEEVDRLKIISFMRENNFRGDLLDMERIRGGLKERGLINYYLHRNKNIEFKRVHRGRRSFRTYD